MSKEQPSSSEEAVTQFRSMRRRSQLTSQTSDVANIFGDPDETESTEVEQQSTGPAHVHAEEQQFGRLRVLLAPKDCPEMLTNSLKNKIAKVGRFCSGAYLFQAGYDTGEDALMICLTDVAEDMRARMEGAIADALVASGHEDHALGVLFLAANHSAIDQIKRLSLVLKADA